MSALRGSCEFIGCSLLTLWLSTRKNGSDVAPEVVFNAAAGLQATLEQLGADGPKLRSGRCGPEGIGVKRVLAVGKYCVLVHVMLDVSNDAAIPPRHAGSVGGDKCLELRVRNRAIDVTISFGEIC